MPFNYLRLHDNISKRDLLDNFDQLINHCNALERKIDDMAVRVNGSSEVVSARGVFSSLNARLNAGVAHPKFFQFTSYRIARDDDGNIDFSYQGLTFFNQKQTIVIPDGQAKINTGTATDLATLDNNIGAFINRTLPRQGGRSYLQYNVSLRIFDFNSFFFSPSYRIETRLYDLRSNRSLILNIANLIKPTVKKFYKNLVLHLKQNIQPTNYASEISRLWRYVRRITGSKEHGDPYPTRVAEFETILTPIHENETRLRDGIIALITPILRGNNSLTKPQADQAIQYYRENFSKPYYTLINYLLEDINTQVIAATNALPDASDKKAMLYYNEANRRIEATTITLNARTVLPSNSPYYPFAVIDGSYLVDNEDVRGTSIQYDPKTDRYATLTGTIAKDNVIVPYSNLEPSNPHYLLTNGGNVKSVYPIKVLPLKATTEGSVFENCDFVKRSVLAHQKATYANCPNLPVTAFDKVSFKNTPAVHERRVFEVSKVYYPTVTSLTVPSYRLRYRTSNGSFTTTRPVYSSDRNIFDIARQGNYRLNRGVGNYTINSHPDQPDWFITVPGKQCKISFRFSMNIGTTIYRYKLNTFFQTSGSAAFASSHANNHNKASLSVSQRNHLSNSVHFFRAGQGDTEVTQLIRRTLNHNNYFYYRFNFQNSYLANHLVKVYLGFARDKVFFFRYFSFGNAANNSTTNMVHLNFKAEALISNQI